MRLQTVNNKIINGRSSNYEWTLVKTTIMKKNIISSILNEDFHCVVINP